MVAQTTQPLERVEALVESIRRRFPEADVAFIDTVCQPTKDRQEAMRRLVDESEVIVVVGGPDSNNSRKLTEFARSRGRTAYQVARASELRPEWFDGVGRRRPHGGDLHAGRRDRGSACLAGGALKNCPEANPQPATPRDPDPLHQLHPNPLVGPCQGNRRASMLTGCKLNASSRLGSLNWGRARSGTRRLAIGVPRPVTKL